ncbi:EVE domain-containing protein [Brevibacterium atlanticum]|uniref:EVE domain-containing protein n=1 Tax=Brevibacterium atlanticum TaxID=2697563 RepID=UPI00141F0E49|nr:EVE domain-containing protein [Brevibacterium atlanticum]
MSAWLAVVAADHVRRGRDLGIVQINHGQRAPLVRMEPGDVVIYYSPTVHRGDKQPLRAFTAFATVGEGDVWQADEGDFKPYRRQAAYAPTRDVALSEINDSLSLTTQPNWGYQLRRGIIPLDDHDVETLRKAMHT